ncbi:hypothetical protein GP5015_846 [gamma proteobacterium HTCC5015]|nr:hypothetical protein GP5015_846 [gamma proteobacterium HTCC5015]
MFCLALSACGGDEAVKEPPPYFYAQEGTPVVAEDSGLADGALRIPRANQELGEYNPKLKEPPVIVVAPELDEEAAEEADRIAREREEAERKAAEKAKKKAKRETSNESAE